VSLGAVAVLVALLSTCGRPLRGWGPDRCRVSLHNVFRKVIAGPAGRACFKTASYKTDVSASLPARLEWIFCISVVLISSAGLAPLFSPRFFLPLLLVRRYRLTVCQPGNHLKPSSIIEFEPFLFTFFLSFTFFFFSPFSFSFLFPPFLFPFQLHLFPA